MYSNRDHASWPTALTPADHLRMARAVAAYDKRQATARRTARLLRLLYAASAVALTVKLFYSAT